MQRSIEVRADKQHGTAQLLKTIPANSVWDCDVRKTLLLIGYLTAPPRYQGMSLANYWAWLRYGIAIKASTPKLRLRRLWAEMDPHQKTILADDFGMGFPCHYLIEQHGFEDFGDTRFVISHLLKGLVAPAGTSKNGPTKSPDFIAVDSLGRLHVLECKGTQSGRAYLEKAIANGIDQKNNLSNSTVFASSMVGGIFVPQHNVKEEAEIVFADPDPAGDILNVTKMESGEIAAGVRRVSLAKMLSAAGLPQAATAILEGAAKSVEPSFLRDLGNNELRFSGYRRNESSGAWDRIVEYRTFEPEGDETERVNGFITRLKTTIPGSIVELFGQALADSGKVNLAAVDTWIEARLASNRSTRNIKMSVPLDGGGTEKRFQAEDRVILGSWTDFDDRQGAAGTRTFSGWTTGQGFGFAIEREQFQ